MGVLKERRGNIGSLEWSPNGRTILAGGKDGTVTLWDIKTGQARATLQQNPPRRHTNSILVSALTGIEWAGDEGARAMYAPDGSTILTTSAEAAPKLWDALTGKLIATLELPADDPKLSRWAGYSPDSRFIAIDNSTSGGLALWDAATGQLKKILRGANSPGSFSLDGHLLAANTCLSWQRAGGCRRMGLGLWDLETGLLKLRLNEFHNSYNPPAWSAESRTLATQISNRKASTWDVATGELKAQVPLGKDRAFVQDAQESLALSPRGEILLTANDKDVKFWNAGNGELLAAQRVEQKGVPLPVAYSSDWKLVVTGGAQPGTVTVWEITEA
jgi:WD40 repeat protein